VSRLIVKDTGRWVRIVDNTVTTRMVLDWIGEGVEVRRNDVGDLRVNQNVPRTGRATSGVIAENRFDVVGQLRHFDGVFERNVVGSADSLGNAPADRAVNFDGYDGARFRNNTIYGYMDARLHGHHHSSGFGMPSHEHMDHMDHHTMMVDHTKRYHEVWITGNDIHTRAGYALAYLDTGHAGNDRTANSEAEPDLNKPHVHYTHVFIRNNRLDGAGILVNVFNAKDEHHPRTARGLVEVSGNQIALETDQLHQFRELQGIEVRSAQDISLVVASNRVTGPAGEVRGATRTPGGAGILLNGLDKGVVRIEDNVIANRSFGVRAARLTETVRWVIRGLATSNVEQPVAYDRSVANPPERG
jgi:hypothetical protein